MTADGVAAGPLRPRLDAALRAALRARDQVARSALRSALAAIDNATAVPGDAASSEDAAVPHDQAAAAPAGSPHFAGAVAGLGAAEAERRRLAEADLEAIVRAEIAERLAAAAGYDQAGQSGAAARLRAEADVLRRVLSAGS